MAEESRKQRLSKFGNLLIEQIKAQQIERGLRASGKSAASLRQIVTNDKITVLGDSSFFYQERGRGPGKFPPPNVIREWIKDKPLRSGISLNSLAFLIGRSIAEKGTLIFQGKKKGLNFKEVVNTSLAIAGNDILEDAIAKDFEAQIDGTIKTTQPK